MTEDKKQWKREFSAGGIVYKKQDSQIFVLMINPKSRNYGPPEKHWSFPKGHIEGGESVETAAQREVEEETGIKAVIKKNLGSVKFTFKWEGENIFKIVTYFLMEYQSGDLTPEREVANVEWVKLEDATGRLKFPGDKETLEKAKTILPSCIIL